MTYLVYSLKPSVVLEGLQSCAIALPQELEPWRDKSPVRPVFALVPTHSSEQDTLWRLARLQVIHIREGDRLLGLLLRLLHLRVRKLDEASDNDLDGCDAAVLRDVLVLHQPFLGGAALTHVDT